MSEFAEVMRQARRMCRVHTDCKGCLLVGLRCVTSSCNWSDEDIADFERIVMDWAKAHPEPQYPTWGEWLAENNDGYLHLMDTLHKPIPADIAERLGLKPKEG